MHARTADTDWILNFGASANEMATPWINIKHEPCVHRDDRRIVTFIYFDIQMFYFILHHRSLTLSAAVKWRWDCLHNDDTTSFPCRWSVPFNGGEMRGHWILIYHYSAFIFGGIGHRMFLHHYRIRLRRREQKQRIQTSRPHKHHAKNTWRSPNFFTVHRASRNRAVTRSQVIVV